MKKVISAVRVKQALADQGMSVDDLCAKARITPQAYEDFLKDRASIIVARRIINLLDVPESELLFGKSKVEISKLELLHIRNELKKQNKIISQIISQLGDIRQDNVIYRSVLALRLDERGDY